MSKPYGIKGTVSKPCTIYVWDTGSGELLAKKEAADAGDYYVLTSSSSGDIMVGAIPTDGSNTTDLRYDITTLEILPETYTYLTNFDLDSYDSVYWIDANYGDDDNAGTSASNACQTWEGMYNKMPADSTNIACILLPGEYWATQNAGSVAYFTGRNNAHYIAAWPGKVFMENAAEGYTDGRDAPMFSGGATGASYYGMVYRHYVGTRTANYSRAFYKETTCNQYNCVFTYSNRSGYHISAVNYDNVGVGVSSWRNCSFCTSFVSPYSGSSYIGVYDGAAVSTLAGGVLSGTVIDATIINQTSLDNFTEPHYWVTNYSNDSYGVNSGTYAWSY